MNRFAWLVLAACSHPSAPGSPPEDRFRPYRAPTALASPGPATVASAQCRADAEAVVDFERARESAALDAELRKSGGMLLVAHEDRRIDRANYKPGGIVRGPAGERWLVVGETGACGEIHETVAINAKLEVFIAYPQAKPVQRRVVNLCQPDCRAGCGIEQERHAVVVEVPDGGHLGAPRDVPYPLDVQIDAGVFDPSGVRITCPKKP